MLAILVVVIRCLAGLQTKEFIKLNLSKKIELIMLSKVEKNRSRKIPFGKFRERNESSLNPDFQFPILNFQLKSASSFLEDDACSEDDYDNRHNRDDWRR